MGAMKDKKLRDAVPSSSDEASESTSTATRNGAGQGNSETDPHVITSSPAVPSSNSDERQVVEANGADQRRP